MLTDACSSYDILFGPEIKYIITCIRCQAQNQADLEKTGAIPSTNLQYITKNRETKFLSASKIWCKKSYNILTSPYMLETNQKGGLQVCIA